MRQGTSPGDALVKQEKQMCNISQHMERSYNFSLFISAKQMLGVRGKMVRWYWKKWYFNWHYKYECVVSKGRRKQGWSTGSAHPLDSAIGGVVMQRGPGGHKGPEGRLLPDGRFYKPQVFCKLVF